MSDASESPVPGSSSPTTSPPPPRRTLFIGVGAAVVVVLAVWSVLGRSGKGGGSEQSINLVTSDRDDLACASDKTIGGHYRCEFKAPGVPWPDPPAPADRLAPYYTVDQQLYVMPALFEQPALAARYKDEQPKNLPRDQRPRFAARCQLKVLDHLRDFQTRWVKAGDWGHQDDAPVAIPSDCQIP